MALVKKSKLTVGTVPPRSELPVRAPTRPSARPPARTEELASGLSEAAAAAEELRRAMEQIASGASEAAGASQEQLAAIKQVVANLGMARTQAEASRRRTEAVEVVLAETAVQIGTSVRAIERNGVRKSASVVLIR